MKAIIELLEGGLSGLTEYLSAHVLTCLIPAFFIAGAITTFVSQAAVLKYLGPAAKKWLSYTIASVSGSILAVCSCTVLPLFGAINKRGAGLGPAVAFLYAAPAINILAIVYSARLLGYDLGIARALGAIIFSVAIGLVMAWLYRKEEARKEQEEFVPSADNPASKSVGQQTLFLGTLVGILVFAAAEIWVAVILSSIALFLILWRWFSRGEVKYWFKETLRFVKLIAPWLLVGVFIAGILRAIVPESLVTDYVGSNSLSANFIASFLGSLMYFATLTEVPIIKAFIDLGMDSGPALALLLAGPALSIPNMLVIRNIMGTKKTLVYISLVVLFATITGYVFGLIN
jgi:uncharacterized protein